METFYDFLLKLEAGETPPPPPAAPDAPPGGAAPPPGDLGGAPGGMPPGGDLGGMGATPPPAPRKPIDITTVWQVLQDVLGKDAHREEKPYKTQQNQTKVDKPKSLRQ